MKGYVIPGLYIESTMRLVFSLFSISASPEMSKFRNFIRFSGKISSVTLISRSSAVGGQGNDFDSVNAC